MKPSTLLAKGRRARRRGHANWKPTSEQAKMMRERRIKPDPEKAP